MRDPQPPPPTDGIPGLSAYIWWWCEVNFGEAARPKSVTITFENGDVLRIPIFPPQPPPGKSSKR